ncbi:DNA recombination protein RmuC [Sulfurivirga sp.]|uniref:DNA recombination protein RmuC n=1 Tax=Sulfurivirga sp. TaxID=2614236 RepID=UPI0025D97668|nr:DNA recombination protein RmuC [Sulfurivirga sp.]
MPELIAIVAILLVVGAAVGLSLWRFEKKRADAAVAENATLKQEKDALRLELAELKVERTTLMEQLGTAQDALAEVREENARLQRTLREQAEKLGELEAVRTQLAEAQQALEEMRQKVRQLSASEGELKARLEEQAGQYEDKLKLLEEARAQLKAEFENLSNRLFEEKQRQFSSRSREQLESLVRPWRDQLEQFRRRLDEVHQQQAQGIGQLQGELKQLRQLNEALSKEAEALAKALRHDSKAQGNWGEQVLERLLEAAGLREGEEFVREASFSTEDGRQRPDVLIRLPEGKHIVVDAKVSLTAYSEALAVEDEKARSRLIKAHVESVRRHIDTLADKAYHQIDGLGAPEFTLMFVPIEGAYLMALEADPHLQEYAFGKGVALVTPPTLLVTLKTVAHLWKLAHQDERVADLLQEAGRLHEKFAGFMKAFDDIRRHIDQAARSWETADTRLQGRGGIVSKIHRIGDLSGRVKKSLSPEALARIDRLPSKPDPEKED